MLLSLHGQSIEELISLIMWLLFCPPTSDDNHLTWWPLASYPVHLLVLISPSIIHFYAWLMVAMRTTLDLICCFAVKQQGCERSWPPARGLSISILVQLCFPSFSTILHQSLPLLFFFLPALSLRYGMERGREKKIEREQRYSTGDCGNPLIKACILIHPKACLTVYYELLCDH